MRSLITEDAEEPPSTISSLMSSSSPLAGARGIPICVNIQEKSLYLSVRKCELGHLSEIYEIERNCFADYIAYEESFIQEELSEGKYFAAFDENDTIIAYFGLDKEDGKIYISNIAVKTDYSRMGIGSGLMNYIHTISRESGAGSIELHVSEYNEAAIKFYSSYGFLVKSFVKDFYAVGDSAYCMAYPL